MRHELTCYDPPVRSRLCSRAARAPTEGASRLTRDGHLFDLRPDDEQSAPDLDLPLHDRDPEPVAEPTASHRLAAGEPGASSPPPTLLNEDADARGAADAAESARDAGMDGPARGDDEWLTVTRADEAGAAAAASIAREARSAVQSSSTGVISSRAIEAGTAVEARAAGETDAALETGTVSYGEGARPTRQRSRSGVIAVAMLVIGLLIGGVGGFIMGQRTAPPNPGRAADAIPALENEPAAPADVVPIPEEPPVTAQDYTAVEPVRPAAAPPAARTSPAPAAARGPAAASATPRPPAAAPASRAATVQFASRPSGASVYVDNVRVGTTPFTLRDVSPGTRRIRMELPDHRPWTTTVTVQPGANARVGASLEQ